MGIIVLAIAILPLLGIGGMQLFAAEAPGPTGDKLHPRITDTAKRLWYIYVGYTAAETILLKVAGMSFFDALNHALATLSTGGFSTKNASVAYWNDQPVIQYIIILFMFLAGSNFVLSYFAFKGKVQKILMVIYGNLFDPVQNTEALHIHAFTVKDTGKIELFPDLDINILFDIDEPQADQDLLVQVTF